MQTIHIILDPLLQKIYKVFVTGQRLILFRKMVVVWSKNLTASMNIFHGNNVECFNVKGILQMKLCFYRTQNYNISNNN
jgi:hypothetical protein